jgi:hypothetical protein
VNTRLDEIAHRRLALVGQAAEQRDRLAAEASDLRQALSMADALRHTGRMLRSRPLAVSLAAAGLMAIGPRRLLRFAYRTGLLLPVAVRLLRIIRTLR